MPTYLCITALTFLAMMMSSNAHAQHMNVHLEPNGSKIITNHTLWTLNATCTIETKAQHRILVSVLDHQGTVNGRNLTNGQAMWVVVHDKDAIAVSAEPGTRVTLQNMGNDAIQASCST